MPFKRPLGAPGRPWKPLLVLSEDPWEFLGAFSGSSLGFCFILESFDKRDLAVLDTELRHLQVV